MSGYASSSFPARAPASAVAAISRASASTVAICRGTCAASCLRSTPRSPCSCAATRRLWRRYTGAPPAPAPGSSPLRAPPTPSKGSPRSSRSDHRSSAANGRSLALAAEAGVFLEDGLGEVRLVIDHLIAQLLVERGEDANREQRGVPGLVRAHG